jgi:hypothetical protein
MQYFAVGVIFVENEFLGGLVRREVEVEVEAEVERLRS